MSATVVDAQVRTYLDALKGHLDDLPEDDRDELLGDLEEHLLEVAAEDDGTLEQRLGPPGAYAEELRASAGLPSREQMPSRRAQRLADRLARSSLWRSTSRLMGTPQVRALRGFLVELRPGWWVLRGYLAVIAISSITGGVARDDVPFPKLGGSYLSGAAFTVGAVAFSVWLGRRTGARRTGRLLSVLLSLFVVVGSSAALAGWDSGSYAYYEDQGYVELPYLHHADGMQIANICPYSSDGKLLSGVLLFDQGGRAIVNTAEALPDGRPVERSLPAILNAYPQSLTVTEMQITLPQGSTTEESKGQLTRTAIPCPASIGAPTPAASPGAAGPATPSPIPGGGR